MSRSSKRKFLSFSFTGQREPKRRLAPKAIARFKQRVRELTRRTRGVKVETMVAQLSRYLLGWRRYFGFCQTPWVLRSLDKWLRRRLRSVVWKQWKRGKVRFAELRKRGVSKDLAAKTAGSAHGPWRLSNSPALNIALPNAYFAALGLIPLVVNLRLNSPNRRVRTRMHGGVTGKASDSLPMSIHRKTSYSNYRPRSQPTRHNQHHPREQWSNGNHYGAIYQHLSIRVFVHIEH